MLLNNGYGGKDKLPLIMTQEEKQLLLKDLCSRLPYGIKGNYQNSNDELLKKVTITYRYLEPNGMVMTGDIKPYLFPLSSITEEQREELKDLGWEFNNSEVNDIIECFVGAYGLYVSHSDCSALIDWFNKNHIDYRNLIGKNLALDATGLNIY